MINAVEARGLTVGYEGGGALFRDLSFTVREGAVEAICGESGCGKSTLLQCICGLIPGSVDADFSGEMLLYDKPVSEYSRAELCGLVGVVFQNPDTQLFCDTVEDELAFGLENMCIPRCEMAARIDEALSLAGLEAYRLSPPDALSGGQKQLVILTAVLIMRPRILLLDEAFSQLDSTSTEKMLAILSELKQKGQTIIMVEHDAENLRLADHIIEL